MKRGRWSSKIGFVFAAAGSAVGLANIWRFPYVVGQNGGAAFILLYLFFLALIGFPVFLSEVVIGKSTKKNACAAFKVAAGNPRWRWAGMLTITTGLFVSAFYSAIAGSILGYLVEAAIGNVSSLSKAEEGAQLYQQLTHTPLWSVTFHLIFVMICTGILHKGVHKGIERGTQVMMPLLFTVLGFLVLNSLWLADNGTAMAFLFAPDWNALTPAAALIALGQAFFTLSLGQGTMITYGSYLAPQERVLSNCLPVVLLDLLVSLLAAIAVFSIAFASGLQPDSGPRLIFLTLPWAFSQLPGGHLLATTFFLLVTLAAMTSQISVMEPLIAYLCDEKRFKRPRATWLTAAATCSLGIPAALFPGLLEIMELLCSTILIPLGGLFAVAVVGWIWKPTQLYHLLHISEKERSLRLYLFVTVKVVAPALILIILLHAFGLLSHRY